MALGLTCLCVLPAPAAEFIEVIPDATPANYQSAYAQDLPIRVQVVAHDTAAALRVSATSRVRVLNGLGWHDIGQLAPTSQLLVKTQPGGLKVEGLQGTELYQGLRLESPNEQSLIQADQAWYRGHLTLTAVKGGFTIVNELPLEQYLYSVVPSEMPASWPIEALKSQAVAARTYALTHLGQYRKRGFDVTSDTSSQVYQGVKAEHSNSLRAVAETAGLIMTYNDQPIQAYFHSTSGGRTENGADLWAPLPYLQPVDDVDQASPKYTWHEEQSQETVRIRLKESLKVQVGKILALQPQDYTSGGRVKTLRVLGSEGQQLISGERVRSALRLNSTFFNVGGVDAEGKLIKQPGKDKIPVSFQFAGRGWGHGMGMSQWGARQLAVDGYPFQSILSHYYRGVRIERLNPARYRLALNR
ncbi:MAG: SpoIID/LytB domain-containing protein [Candidatus Sericytochromatia bacterium]